MRNFHFSRRAAFILTALFCLFLSEFSSVRAEGYQISQNTQPNVEGLSDQQTSPDGKYAVYLIYSFDENYNRIGQLFSVDLATKNRQAITPRVGGSGKFLGSFQITPDSLYVIYTASLEADANSRGELYSIPIAAGSQSQRRNIVDIPASSSADVYGFSVSPDSLHVVYQLAEISPANEYSATLFSVAPTGGAATQLTPRAANTSANGFIFAPDSRRLAYYYNSPASPNTQLQSVSITGQGRKTLTDRLSGGGAPAITSDSQRLVFTADFSTAGDRPARLYSITLTGSETRKQLSRNGEEVYNFKFANGYPVVVYAFKPNRSAANAPTAFGFVAADKSFESVAYDTGKEIFVNNYVVSPDNSAIVYIAGDYSVSQLYSLTYQSSNPVERQLSVAAANQPAFYSVTDFKIAGNSQRVVFQAGQNGSSPNDLYSAAIPNSSIAVKLDTVPLENTEDGLYRGISLYFILPNSQRVIFNYAPSDGSCCGTDLYTNAVTGGVPSAPFATNANEYPVSDAPKLTADGRRVIYKKTLYDEFGNFSFSLWAANVPQ